MSHFEVKIPRDLAIRLGTEAVHISRQGGYELADGTKHSVACQRVEEQQAILAEFAHAGGVEVSGAP